MFSTIASYLLGSSNNQPEDGVEERNVRLTSIVAEDDWVLVDRDSEGNSEDDSSSRESLEGCGKIKRRNKLPQILTCSSSTASLPCTTMMEESWFVTPPPCFTSAGPVHLETSPLENLLIEHPSMSVYQHSFPSFLNSVPDDSVDSDFSVEGEEFEEIETQNTLLQKLLFGVVKENKKIEVQMQVQVQMPQINIIETYIRQEQQQLERKKAQKVNKKKPCQALKRKHLERANKAREVNNRNRPQRRSERSQGATRSYANNNRKC